MLKYSLILISGMLLFSAEALAQDTNAATQPATPAVKPLLKMEKPKLKVVFEKRPMEEFEADEVVSEGTKLNDPIICKKREKLGSRLSKGREYCARKSQWESQNRNIKRQVRDATNM